MPPRVPEETPAEKSARVFFDRRRTGLDGKVRSLILGLANKHNVDINVTVIYEYKDEISIFRSQPGDTGRWFPTVRDLRARSINSTDMGHVDPMTRELLEWHARQHQQTSAALEPPSTPQRATRSQVSQARNGSVVVGQHQGQGADQTDDGDDAAANETDEDDRTDADYPDDSEEESEDDDYQLVDKPVNLGNVKKEPACEELAGISHQSPKRRRGMVEDTSHGDVSSFLSPSPQPVYHTYGQLNGGSPQMQLAGPANGLGTFLPQTGIAPMTIMSHPQNGMTPDNCFYSDMSLGNFDLGSGYSSERAPQVVPFRNQSRSDLPQPPLPKKGRTAKGSKKGGKGVLKRTKTS